MVELFIKKIRNKIFTKAINGFFSNSELLKGKPQIVYKLCEKRDFHEVYMVYSFKMFSTQPADDLTRSKHVAVLILYNNYCVRW